MRLKCSFYLCWCCFVGFFCSLSSANLKLLLNLKWLLKLRLLFHLSCSAHVKQCTLIRRCGHLNWIFQYFNQYRSAFIRWKMGWVRGETLHVSFIEKRVRIFSVMTHLVDAILIENRLKLCFSIQIRSTNMRFVYFNPKPETTYICFTFSFILFAEKRISEEVDLNCKPFFYLCPVLVCDHFHLNQLRRFLGIKSKRFHSKKK